MILEALKTVSAFVITLGVLVSFHEYGHFWVARRCGVKVLKFSIGFGMTLYKWQDRYGTEFCIGLVPLGGFVKMLDEREGHVAQDEQHLSFDSKSVRSRFAIVMAGPMANFLLAIGALWLMYMLGVRVLTPLVGEVVANSPASMVGIQPGDEILNVNGVDTPGWHDVNMELLRYIGESRHIDISVRSGHSVKMADDVAVKNIVIDNWLSQEGQTNPINALGIVPYTPLIPAVIGHLEKDGAGFRDGLRVGDRIIRVDGAEITEWKHFVESVRDHAGRSLQLDVERRDGQHNITLIPNTKYNDGVEVGYIGAGAQLIQWPETMFRYLDYGPVDSLIKSAQVTWSMTSMTIESLWKMVVGLVSVKNLGGPIAIAKAAGASFDDGMEYFLYFLAMLSVSLGVINLLPVPILDGGHLLFFLIEMITGKPVSEKTQTVGAKIGVTFLVGVLMLAMYNDLSHLLQ